MDNSKQKPFEAVLWQKTDGNTVRCLLCNFMCLIADSKTGRCNVRKNIGGVLYSLNYNHICSAAIDPIEKKPLFHFYPNSQSFSIACQGCNFKCDFCQNWQISQADSSIDGNSYSPEQLVDAAIENHCKSISYTYTEPTVFFEIASQTAKLAKQKMLKNVFVSNGYMSRQCIEQCDGWLDAINIDLKAFTEDYYRQFCKATLAPVLENIEYIAKNTDIWLELTTLIIPNRNDSEDELKKAAEFIAEKAGVNTPWHISRFYPNYKCRSTKATPEKTLETAFKIGKQAGLNYVYVGNMLGCGYEDTLCPSCGNNLIQRAGYQINKFNIENGKCPKCNFNIAGRF